MFRQSDRSLTTRRGFTSRGAAQAARAATVEEVRRGDVIVNRGTFAEFWDQLLQAKRPYVTPGTLQDYKTHGRKRLLPWFGELRLATIDQDRVRDWIGDMAELVADGELRPKTVNNARTCLAMTPGEAVRRAREGAGTTQTKGKRSAPCRSARGSSRHSGVCASSAHARVSQTTAGRFCVAPLRGRYAGRTTPVPPNRKTVHD